MVLQDVMLVLHCLQIAAMLYGTSFVAARYAGIQDFLHSDPAASVADASTATSPAAPGKSGDYMHCKTLVANGGQPIGSHFNVEGFSRTLLSDPAAPVAMAAIAISPAAPSNQAPCDSCSNLACARTKQLHAESKWRQIDDMEAAVLSSLWQKCRN